MIVPIRVDVIGCGTISGPYLKNMGASPYLNVVACADQVLERAQARARAFGVSNVCTTDELLGSDEVELVVNLTVPLAHAEISVAGTQWLVVEQDQPRRDPMESLSISYANLVRLAAEVGLEA